MSAEVEFKVVAFGPKTAQAFMDVLGPKFRSFLESYSEAPGSKHTAAMLVVLLGSVVMAASEYTCEEASVTMCVKKLAALAQLLEHSIAEDREKGAAPN